MKNNALYIVFFIASFATLDAQNISFGVVEQNPTIIITDEGGQSNQDAFYFNLQGSGNSSIDKGTWRISVEAIDLDGFPADKISFQPSNTTSNPSIDEIGMPTHVPFQQTAEVFLVPQSNASFSGTFDLYYHVSVAGGAYLNTYPENSEFILPLRARFYYKKNKNKTDILTTEFNLKIQIQIPPVTPQFSIEVNADASNGLLELKSVNDYEQGTQITYTGGLTVSANTDYQVQVRSSQDLFSSPSGNTLALEAISVLLSAGANNPATTNPVPLSNLEQIIATGGTTEGTPVNFDITYKSNPNDPNLINAPSDIYSTTLQYIITPQ
ncbi:MULTISPECIES: hypothetical protein [Arenibacter]|uniref:hypothetical protein n=1 Tax=Arenibacter TaxID=178469 RepID=UPI000A37A1DA|nr:MULTISPECIES: hypothetical protein [Arenibacter]